VHQTKAIADTDYDLDRSNYEMALANVALCKAQIDQSEGARALAKTNLDYTQITSPVDGIVTDRKVDPGQSLAAAYQTPVLFVVAPDLEKRVYVLASVDEADIGLICAAQTPRWMTSRHRRVGADGERGYRRACPPQPGFARAPTIAAMDPSRWPSRTPGRR